MYSGSTSDRRITFLTSYFGKYIDKRKESNNRDTNINDDIDDDDDNFDKYRSTAKGKRKEKLLDLSSS